MQSRAKRPVDSKLFDVRRFLSVLPPDRLVGVRVSSVSLVSTGAVQSDQLLASIESLLSCNAALCARSFCCSVQAIPLNQTTERSSRAIHLTTASTGRPMISGAMASAGACLV